MMALMSGLYLFTNEEGKLYFFPFAIVNSKAFSLPFLFT